MRSSIIPDLSCCFFGLLGLGLLFWGLGCGKKGLVDEAALPGGVVLVTVDTLRADRLSCYGYSRPTSPHIDRLAADSLLFLDATTPRTSTAPSMASALTGLYPYHHGVTTNFIQVHESLTTLPEIMTEAGHESGAFVSNYVLIRELSGLDQGFDVYDDFVATREPKRAIYERRAEDTIESAISWLNDRSGRFFLWVHLIDPHGPYLPPEPFNQKFGPGPSKPLAPTKIPAYQRTGSSNASDYLDQYDGEIAYCDEQIGRLLVHLEELGLYDNSLILFHADHGESLGEHGVWFQHGSDLYEECARIPFVMKLPGMSKATGDSNAFGISPGVVDLPVSVVDIPPTILDALDVDSKVDFDGQSLILALSKGKRTDPFLLMDQVGYGQPKTYVGLRSGDRKLIYYVDQEKDLAVLRREFYWLNRDPLEARNVYSPKDPDQAELEERLQTWLLEIREYRRPFEAVRWRPPDGDEFMTDRNGDSKHVEELKRLGYLK